MNNRKQNVAGSVLGLYLVLAVLWLAPFRARGQAVLVTARLDATVLAVGQTTTLRVYAQVAPNLRTNAERIFSWYVDVLNTNGAVATARYEEMIKASSDNDLLLSSTGVTDGAHRRGVRDTFLNLAGAGVSNAVELMAIPVQATAGGTTRFLIRAGTGDPFLSADFLVAPKDGGDPYNGGSYDAAQAGLTVSAACQVSLQIQPIGGVGPGGRLQLSYAPCAGRTHTVESRTLVEGGPWQALPGAPHNSGSVVVTNSQPRQVFRVRVD